MPAVQGAASLLLPAVRRCTRSHPLCPLVSEGPRGGSRGAAVRQSFDLRWVDRVHAWRSAVAPSPERVRVLLISVRELAWVIWVQAAPSAYARGAGVFIARHEGMQAQSRFAEARGGAGRVRRATSHLAHEGQRLTRVRFESRLNEFVYTCQPFNRTRLG